MSKSKIQKEISFLRQKLKEANKDYDRIASKSINPDVDLAVIRALEIKQKLNTQLTALKLQLADYSSSQQ